MYKITKTVIAAGIVAAGLAAGAAQAAFITGGISFSDGFGTLPGVGSTTIVSQLTAMDLDNTVGGTGSFGRSGDFLLTGTSATASDIDTGGPFSLIYTTVGGTVFTFNNTSILNIIRSAVSCAIVSGFNVCHDTLTFDMTGNVTGGAFSATLWSGNWTANGSCTANASNQCQSAITASWSSSLNANGQTTVPEPATLGLLGIALAGLGFSRRRKQV
jgi:hypothetical protein